MITIKFDEAKTVILALNKADIDYLMKGKMLCCTGKTMRELAAGSNLVAIMYGETDEAIYADLTALGLKLDETPDDL